VLPSGERGSPSFEDVDVARLRLIAELRPDFAVNDEAVPLVLRLVEHVHLLGECLGAVAMALEELPQEERRRVQRLILERLRLD